MARKKTSSGKKKNGLKEGGASKVPAVQLEHNEGYDETAEEYINLEDELSLDTIKEIDTNQEQSRNNTH